jgi:hypothetical protein
MRAPCSSSIRIQDRARAAQPGSNHQAQETAGMQQAHTRSEPREHEADMKRATAGRQGQASQKQEPLEQSPAEALAAVAAAHTTRSVELRCGLTATQLRLHQQQIERERKRVRERARSGASRTPRASCRRLAWYSICTAAKIVGRLPNSCVQRAQVLHQHCAVLRQKTCAQHNRQSAQ